VLRENLSLPAVILEPQKVRFHRRRLLRVRTRFFLCREVGAGSRWLVGGLAHRLLGVTHNWRTVALFIALFYRKVCKVFL
jgi:hypothetical protein